MAESEGEITYQQFTIILQRRFSARFITARDVQSLGRFYWSIMSNEFKEIAIQEHGRQTFWSFAQFIK